jgi:hypothetical protein
MATADDYAGWIVKNAAKKGTPEFDTVAAAYKEALAEERSLPPVTVTPDSMTVSEVPGPRKYSLAEVPSAAISNIPSSFARQVEGLASAVSSPIDTTRDLLRLIGGAGLKALPESVQKTIVSNSYDPTSVQQAIDSAGAVGDFYKQRYGTADGFKRAVAEDPVGVLADFSTLVGGAAGLAGKAGMAKTATGLGAVSAYTNPLTPVVKAAAVPVKAAAQGVGYARNVLAPKEAGLLAAAEGQGQEIVNALRNYDQYVASGMPTAGAVVAGELTAPRYAALQQQVSQLKPREYMEREAANVAARGKALGTIAQDEAALAAAERARSGVSTPLYTAAKQGTADVSGVIPVLDDLIAKNPGNRELVREMRQIRNDLIADSKTGTLRSDAGEIVSVIDGIKTRLAKEDTKFIKGKLRDVRELLTDAVPGYRTAQETFAEASKPINVMQVGQYLEGKLKPAIETSVGERAGVFSEAVKNAPTTIKRSTGESRFTNLGQILEPDQVKVVEGIRKDLAREAEFTKQAREGGKAGEVFPATETARLPNLMSRVASVANTIITKLQGKIDKKLALELATEMLDPKLAAAAMEKALQRQAKGEKLAEPFKKVGRAAFEAGRSPLTLGGVQVTNALAAESQNNLGK